ncbi:uncharacterized protein F5147DRAFT_772291 [Suillus discolor]|uniref:GST N-terminal domain-containing protein n=1 Tax=Suillus discolor TaxID=1912936 RepID=A0A9P7JVC6_9AGAM|nr:uncharacterized protein F5147DRAFT_772291 [Suillus discolor]KAG2110512.1 hypothetical protein F5147DRAFT_772291 [Suillus discolor]
MAVTKIIFLDILTVLPVPTSPNTWKVRLTLNYKELTYRTKWVETTDIESVCKSLGIPPTSMLPDGTPKYTLPALIDNTFTPPAVLSDSNPIIEYLERTYPDPDSSRAVCPPASCALHAIFEYHVAQPHGIASTSVNVPKRHLGKKLEDIELKGKDREEHWNKIERAFDLLATSMRARSGPGELFTGSNLSLADCTLGGLLLALRYDSPDEAWMKVSSWSNGKWIRYMAALSKWTAVE